MPVNWFLNEAVQVPAGWPENPPIEFNELGANGNAQAGQGGLWAQAQAAQHDGPQNAQQALGAAYVIPNHLLEEYANMYKGKKVKIDTLTGARSASPLSDEYLALKAQTEGLAKSIHQESAELAGALESLAKITEVVRDIGSTVRTRISTLQMVATQLEKWRLSLPLPDSLRSEIKQAEDRFAPQPVDQPAVAGAQAIAPGLWQQGQG